MIGIGKQFDLITKADLDALQANCVAEGKMIDYKQCLPGPSDADKLEFLRDASSFANASGGDLVYGVVEAGGVPTAVPGLVSVNVDGEILRMDNILQTGIAPRLPGVQMRTITGFAQGPIILLRVPNSWDGPHMVNSKGNSQFYTRNNGGKYQMDVAEIRSAFALSESLPERIQRFRTERLGKIVAGETPFTLKKNAMLVLHIIPLSAFSTKRNLDMALIGSQCGSLPPIGGAGQDSRINVDGIVTFSRWRGDDEITRYCQLFRSGIIESVYANVIKPHDGESFIGSVGYERDIIKAVNSYLKCLRELGVVPPLVITMALLGAKGAFMYVGPGQSRMYAVDRENLQLPDILIDEYGIDIPRKLKPIFDAVWNACGFERSLNYDQAGNWSER